MRFSSIEYKVQIRDFLNRSLTIDLKIVIIIFPVLFGIYKVLCSKHSTHGSLFLNEKIISNSLQQNLPGISVEPTKISWQTFDQIFSDQLKFDQLEVETRPQTLIENSGETYVQQVDFYNQFIIINTNQNWYKKQKKLYAGFFNKMLAAKTDSIGNNWSSVSSKKFYTFRNWSSTAGPTTYQVPRKLQTQSNQILSSSSNNKSQDYDPSKTRSFHVGTSYVAPDGLRNTIPADSTAWTKKLEKFINYLRLDELPLKLNGVYTEKKSNLHYKVVSSNIIAETTLASSIYHAPGAGFSQLNCENKTQDSQLENVTNFSLSSQIFVKKFKLIKVQQFTNFFPNVKQANTINVFWPRLVGFLQNTENLPASLLLRGVENTKVDSQFRDLNVKPVFFKNQKNTKGEYLEHLLKIYTLNRNITPLPNYTVLRKKFNNIVGIYKQNSGINLISKADVSTASLSKPGTTCLEISNSKKNLASTSNLPKSLKLLFLLEEFVFLDKNIEIAPRLMSGYTIPDNSHIHNFYPLKKSYNIFKSQHDHVQRAQLHSDQIPSTIDLKVLKNNFHPIESLSSVRGHSVASKAIKNVKTSKQADKSGTQYKNFKFLAKEVSYSNAEKKIYDGVSVFQNELTNEPKINNSSQTKKLVKQFLYSDNPLTDRQRHFFGNYATKIEKITRELIESQKTNREPTTKSLVALARDSVQSTLNVHGLDVSVATCRLPVFTKNKYEEFFATALDPNTKISAVTEKTIKLLDYLKIRSSVETFSKSRSGYIVYLNELDWNTFLTKLEAVKKLTDKNIFPIPIKSFYQPNKLLILWPVNQLDFKRAFSFSKLENSNTATNDFVEAQSKNNTSNICDNYKVLPLLESKKNYQGPAGPLVLGTQGQLKNGTKYKKLMLKYHYLPYSQSLSKERLSRQFSFGQTYKKKYSTYKNENLPSAKQRARGASVGFSQNAKNLPRAYKNSETQPDKALFYNANKTIVNVPVYDKKLTKFTELFYEPVEPISYDSWLVVTQFSIGFFLIRIFQNILQKYQQEIKYAILNLLENKDSNSGEFISEQDSLSSQFRIIKNIKKNFDNIAGIDAILPELGEIIWFLRNSGRSFKTGKTIPQGILLTGPPGTGKTLLVQAIAGEAEVPVLIESANSLQQSGPSMNSSERLKNLFAKAREIAPCIIFIDEIDTFGKARSTMMENPVLTNSILDSIYPNNQAVLDAFTPLSSSNHGVGGSTKHQHPNSFKNKVNKENSNLLMQLLIELDGIATDKKVLVFGATNRPQILDSALTRPGRFNKTLHLKLPNKQKRIEIVKLYSDNIGVEKNISWQYIANLTIGLSAADLASAINQSSIQAIQAETIHTIQTIEYGIESVTGYSSQKSKLKSFARAKQQIYSSFNVKQNLSYPKRGTGHVQSTRYLDTSDIRVSGLRKNFTNTVDVEKFLFINRLAYYQAGKIVVHTLLKKHPAIISIQLWPKLKSQRYHLMQGILEKEFSQIYRRVQLESRIIGFYAGKAGEFINLFATIHQKKIKVSEISVKMQLNLKNSLYIWQSDLGMQDISFASWLADLMINKWYLYSKKISLQNFNKLKKNYNTEQISSIGTAQFLQKNLVIQKLEPLKLNIQLKKILKIGLQSLGYKSKLRKNLSFHIRQKTIGIKFMVEILSKTKIHNISRLRHIFIIIHI